MININRAVLKKEKMRFGFLKIVIAALLLISPISSAFAGEKQTVDLQTIPTTIQISSGVDQLTLTRGAYTYIFNKKSEMNNKLFVAEQTDPLRFNSNHKPAPEDAYSRTLFVVPGDDDSAVRAIKSPQTGTWILKTEEDRKNAERLSDDFNHLNSAKFSIGILPATQKIRKLSKKIRKGNTFKISGVHYKISKAFHNGSETPLSHCQAAIDLFYLTALGPK